MEMNRNIKARKALGILILMLPVTLMFLGFLLPKLPSSPMMRDSFWASKIDSKAEYDIIYVGDSRVYRGIDPDLIEKETGLKGFNFGFSSAGLDSALIFESCKRLKPNGKKILLIGVSANAFLPSSLENEHFNSILKWKGADIWIRRHLYPKLRYFDHRAVSDLYKHLKGEHYYEDYRTHNGFAASSKVPSDSNSAIDAYRMQFERESYNKSAELRFKKILFRLKRENIRCVLVRIPCSSAMIELEDNAVGGKIELLLEDLEREGFQVVRTSSEAMKSYDGSHLDSTSAALFSRQLAELLK